MVEKKEKDIFADDNFGPESEVSSNTIDWGKIGDFVVGTFVKARHDIETQYGPNSIYEFYTEKGSFHRLVSGKPEGNPTEVKKGESWSVWGRNDLFNGQMNSLRPGQVVKLTFVEETKGQGNPAKIIKIYAPKNNEGKPIMNQEWLDNQDVTGGDM
jgi:hypothetical protein